MNTRKNRWSRPIAALLALIMLLGMVPTVWADGENPPAADPVATAVEINGATTVLVGKTITLSATVQPSNISQDVSWNSENTAVATVSNGVVTGMSIGTAVITATAAISGAGGAEVSSSVTVTVKAEEVDPGKVTDIEITSKKTTLIVGQQHTLGFTITPSTASSQPVSWGSSDDAVISVENGVLTAHKAGTATITAVADGKTDSCTIAVIQPVESVSLSVNDGSKMKNGSTITIEAVVFPADASDRTVVWSTSDSSRATVDSSGVVRAVGEGEVTITATTNGKDASGNSITASCKIIVEPAERKPVTGVTISAPSSTVAVGKSITLTANVTPSDATNKNVTWTSKDTLVATVNRDTGVVTGVKAGTATIVATTVDGGMTATCNVTVTGNVAVTGVSLNYSTRTISVGETFRLTPTIAPSNATNKEVTWASSATAYATVDSSGNVKGIKAGTTTITVTTKDGSKKATCAVTVTKTAADTITYRVSENEEAAFNRSDFNKVCKGLTGSALDYVRFTLPSASRGVLYYDYDSSDTNNTKVSSSKKYYYTAPDPYIERISFVPKSGYSGTVTIDYTGRDVDGTDFTGTVEIAVGEGGGSGDIEYTTSKDTPVDMDDSDFNAYCKDENGYNFDYVQFSSLPASSKGVLYYDYSSSDKTHTKVKTSTKYYRSESPYLDDVTFVPDEDFTGTVTIPFTGYDTRGRKFSGDLVITVGSDEEITYTTNKNTAVDLIERDFVNYSKAQTNNSTFDYIQFTTLPSSTKGTLYYDYAASSKNNEKVTRTGKYYRTKDPALEDITFVPASGYTGVVTIPFTGYSDSGRKFSGDLKITVGSGGNVTYTATAGQSVEFDDADFNAYCKDETGANLDFVQFTLPSSAQGTLYSGTKKATSSSTKYYRSSPSPYLDDVSFTPAKSNTTTIRIPFTGESVKGDEFSGTVVISYTFAPAVIKYTSNGSAVTFKAKDFSDVCTNRGGKAALSSVQFDMATTTNGKLYASYANGTGSTVNTSTSYKVSGSPSLGNVTFVPKSGYSGKVNLTYTGTDANGDTYRGTVEITVTPAAANTNFKDMGNHSWAASSVDFLSKSGIVTGVDTTHYGPEKPITRGDFVLMLYRAFDMKSSGKSSFSDVPQNSYYAEAVAAAKALGIATGSNGKFNPGAPLTRQDAMVLIQRTMSATGRPLTAGDTSILNSFKDRNRVSDYAANAVAALVRSGLIKGDDGKLNPTASISRAEMAVLLHRVLTM
ncbi:MAG: hypothetical protein HFF61_04090 [Oscillospiraceae bacterium]|nr:hypothetical protein [Oscillospiraceae bacterium]